MNEFIYAITFISSSDERTVSAGVPTDLIRGDVFFWGSLMAATLIPSIPLALLYNLFLDRFIAASPAARSARKEQDPTNRRRDDGHEERRWRGTGAHAGGS